jgi:hypothetical protein
METGRIAFAPKFDLLSVPSISSIFLSIFSCSKTFIPNISEEILFSIFFIAFKTPLPPYLSPPSLNSMASKSPVEAPLGTCAQALIFLPKKFFAVISTSTVGFPLESKISIAFILFILYIIYLF